jgi:hypothetical protein
MRSGSDYELSMAVDSFRRKSGNNELVAEITRPSPQSLRPNWWAIACLYLVVASWLALALRIMLDEILSIDSARWTGHT